MSLTDQVAIVTGASRGIGRAISLALANAGAHIVVAARPEPIPGTVEETAVMVRELGREALPLDMDVASETDVKHTIDETLERFGRIDIMVNNAGTNWSRNVADFESKRWELVMKVNVLGPFLCSKHVLPHMMERGSGHILNISSISAIRPHPGSSAYSASKAALDALTIASSMETHEHGVQVNALRVEGTIETPGTTMLLQLKPKEPMWPAEIVGVAASYVCSRPFPYTGNICTLAELRSSVPRIDEILSGLEQQSGAERS